MSLDLDGVYKEIDDICYDIIDEKTEKGFNKLKEFTPEDTFDLQNDNSRTEVIEQGGNLHTRIYNENDHAELVEYSKNTKNYYKNSGRKSGAEPFMVGKGAGMMRKTKNFLENN